MNSMTQREYNELMQALKEQQIAVSSSKEAARDFLQKAGILHLLVPKKKKNRRRIKNTPGKSHEYK